MKKYHLAILFLFSAVLLAGCGQKNVPISGGDNKPKGESAAKQTPVKTEIGGLDNVCSYFPKELVESAIGKPIVKMEVSMVGEEICNYYTLYSDTYDHTPYGDKPGGTPIVAVYDTKDYTKDKTTNEKFGSKYGTDPSIGMANYVVRNNVDKVWQTALILGGDRYLRIHFVHDACTGDDLVKIAKKFAEKIKGDPSIVLSNQAAPEEKPAAESQQAIAYSFFEKISLGKIDEAVNMMDANEETKKAWKTTFSTIKSLKVNGVEPSFQEEWTPTRQTYKLNVFTEVTPEGVSYGWNNGQNFRWVTLEKNASGEWIVHELASNP